MFSISLRVWFILKNPSSERYIIVCLWLATAFCGASFARYDARWKWNCEARWADLFRTLWWLFYICFCFWLWNSMRMPWFGNANPLQISGTWELIQTNCISSKTHVYHFGHWLNAIILICAFVTSVGERSLFVSFVFFFDQHSRFIAIRMQITGHNL